MTPATAEQPPRPHPAPPDRPDADRAPVPVRVAFEYLRHCRAIRNPSREFEYADDGGREVTPHEAAVEGAALDLIGTYLGLARDAILDATPQQESERDAT